MHNSSLTLSRIGIILSMDTEINDLLFKRGADYMHKNFTQLFHPSKKEMLRQFLDRVFTTEKLQCIEFHSGPAFYQLKCVLSQPGKAICIITGSEKERRVLSELEEQNFKALVDTYSDWVWSFDTNFTLITANRAFFDARRQINNVDLHLGDNIFKGVKDDICKKWRPIYERALHGEIICFEEKRNNRVYDYYVDIYLTPVYNDDGDIIGCLGVTRDITARKEAQFAIEGYTSKLEEFALKTSHDLRRPIANITGMADMLKNKMLNEEEKTKTVDYIADSVKDLDEIVISMIDLIDQYKSKIPV
jgi:PAS domain-containing protein